jgi:hypothetical protein
MDMGKRNGRGLFEVPCCYLAGGTEKDVCWARIRTAKFPERYCLSQLPQYEAGLLHHIFTPYFSLLIDASSII